MKRTFKSKLLCIGISLCVVPPVWGQQKTVSQDGVSLNYDTRMFSKVEIVELKKEPLPDRHDRLNVHPANLLFLFYKSSQYAGSIKLYPLQDSSVKDLKTAYPELPERLNALTSLLLERRALPERYPNGNPKEIPTIQSQMSTQYFLSHLKYLDFSWGSGIGFLVTGTYKMQAIMQSGGGFVTRLKQSVPLIKLRFRHISTLPIPIYRTPKKTASLLMNTERTYGEVDYLKYLRQMEKFLDEKSETTFRPPLDSIQKLVGSLRFENVDPANWGSKFSSKTTVTE